ncbi:MAG: hypothetical protein K2Y40_12690 [Reyranella sp.]|nr:hypothetical protein [Reyranella sp.]
MSRLLSRQIEDALKAIDATPAPTRDQLLELVDSQRLLMEHTRRFAAEIEDAHRRFPGTVPMMAASTAAARLYRDLATGRPLPDQYGPVIAVDFARRS